MHVTTITFNFTAWCIVVMPSLHFNYNIFSWNKAFQLIMYVSELLVTARDIEIQVFCDVMPCLWDNIAKKHTATPLGLAFSKRQLDAQFLYFYNMFITVLYMFRAKSCSSSGGQIILIQHLVWSLSVIGRPVHRMATYRE